MIGEQNITASIVIYKENLATLQKAIHSFLASRLANKLYIIDNSPTNTIQEKINHPKIEYLFSGSNLGFGKGHNKVLNRIKKEESNFHLILNPDVTFKPNILIDLKEELEKNDELSMISPKVLFSNRELQYTARKFPSILGLTCRYLGVFKKKKTQEEYRNQDLNLSFCPDFIHGSFMLFKAKDLINLNGFDERFFLYMEDIDICRRIDQLGKKKMYYPSVEIFHELRKGSSKNMKLFFIHISSVIKYFKKWGL